MKNNPLKQEYETEKSLIVKLQNHHLFTDLEVLEMMRQLNDLLSMRDAVNDYLTYVALMWQFHAGGASMSMHFGIEAIADHVQAALKREIKRLIISIPPRHAKSSLTSISAPSWQWLHNPSEQFYYLSYDLSLCKDNMIKAKNIIESYLYRPFITLGNDKYIYSITKDSAKSDGKIFNNKGGYLIAGSPESGTLGKGYTVGLVDDLTKSESALDLKKANEYYSSKLMDRENDAKNTVKIIIMQRIDPYDLVGYVKEKYAEENWIELTIPFERDEKSLVQITNWENAKIKNDPRQIGEILDPKRFPPSQVMSLKSDPVVWETKHQQRPPKVSKLEVSILSRTYIVEETNFIPPYFNSIVTGWDTADSPSENKTNNSKTVAITIGLYNNKLYVFDMLRGSFDLITSLRLFREFATKYPQQKNVIENKTMGKTLAKYYTDANIDVELANASNYGVANDKETRFKTLVELFHSWKIVFLKNSPFSNIKSHESYILEDIYNELTSPVIENDDIRDALYYAVAKIILYENIVSMPLNNLILTEQDTFIRTTSGENIRYDQINLDTDLDYTSGYVNFKQLRNIQW